MVRRRKKKPNWPYRFAWIAVLAALVSYVAAKTAIAAMTFANRSYGIDWSLALVNSCLDATIGVWFVAFGACIGSFLNVVAYRLPLGRSIGGHSSCPFCATPIDGTDNVPVMGWIKLRGRCRRCRLPISIQYPLVELTVAVVFAIVYVTEFSRYGANFPGTLKRFVTPELILRSVTYLFLLSGLLAAALMAVKRRIVPMTLFVWSILPLLACGLILPSAAIIRWRSVEPYGPIEDRLDVLTTFLCGAVAGIAIARLLAPLVYKGFDRGLTMSDPASVGARQFVASMGLAGAIVGWQSVVPLAWCVVLSGIFGGCLFRNFRDKANLADLTCWVWLGLIIFRGNWSGWLAITIFPSSLPEVVRHVAGAILLAPLAVLFTRVAQSSIPDPASQLMSPDDEEDEPDEEEEVTPGQIRDSHWGQN